MSKNIKEIFGTEKPIIGMLHLKGESDKEILLYFYSSCSTSPFFFLLLLSRYNMPAFL